MAEMKGKKKRLSINLSFLNLTDHNGSTKLNNAHKSPRTFEEPNGVVGLGILAALDYQNNQDPISINGSRTAVLAISPKSLANPIPVLGNENLFKKTYGKKLSVEEMESCEEYTCVISHVGENLIKKREYFYADFMGNNDGSPGASAVNGNGGGFGLSSGVVSDSLFCYYGGETATFCTADFLSSCFICKKTLHGLDIFMYRGEKAFCSVECRYKQISIDEQKEKCHAGARKPVDYSISPCSSALQFIAGVAAA